MSESNKSVERNMYTGPSSRKPKRSFIFAILIGLFLIGFGVYRYYSISHELSLGHEVEVHTLEKFIYELTDVWGIALGYVVIGLGTMALGYREYRNRTDLPNPSE